MPTYSIRINTSTGTYHIFNSLNANNDRDTSYCGNVDYDETEVVEGSSNLDRDDVIQEMSMGQNEGFCQSCRIAFNS